MAYVALYREWRPQKFSEVVGQAHVTRTLVNALKQSRISHAYLFCGPRGTGKTSIAKILAKAVNCLEPLEGEPCNQCANCQSINHGGSLDVLEIDAASNRGIDEIRDLRERVQFVPSGGRFRVYIIDEVHMLTTEAFNALLKTLEEPPEHVIFVLATTEAHRLPATILSRCQRFDFHRISQADLMERLRLVADNNEITVTEEALAVMVQAAEGGLRDALSLLDQCIGFTDGDIQIEDVNQVLGTVTDELLAQVVGALKKNDAAALIRLVGLVIEQGKDIRKFVRDLIGYLRDLLLLKMGARTDQLVVASASKNRISQADLWRAEQLIGLIRFFTQLETDLKWAIQPRWMLEAALIEAAEQQGADRIGELERRIEALEQAGVIDLNLEPDPEPDPKTSPAGRAALPAKLPESRPGPPEKQRKTGVPGSSGTLESPGRPAAAEFSGSPKSTGRPGSPGLPSTGRPGSTGSPGSLSAPAAQTNTAAPKETASVAGSADGAGENQALDRAGIKRQWKPFLEMLRKRNVALQALLLEAEPVEWREGILYLAFRKGCNFHKQKAEEPGNKNLVEELLGQIFKQPLQLCCLMQEDWESSLATSPATRDNRSEEADPDPDPWQEPLVQAAAKIFGADRIKLTDE